MTTALQVGDALGARTAEHLRQRKVVEVCRVLELRGVRAWLVGVAAGEQHRIGVERRGQQLRFRLRALSLEIAHFRQGVEVRPVHAGGDRLGAERGDDGVGLGVKSVDQCGATKDGAGCFAELIAGEGGAVQVFIGRLEVHTLYLHRRAAGSESNRQQQAGQQTRLAAAGRGPMNHAGHRPLVVRTVWPSGLGRCAVFYAQAVLYHAYADRTSIAHGLVGSTKATDQVVSVGGSPTREPQSGSTATC